MTIQKDGKSYVGTERDAEWTVLREVDTLTIEYKVPKTMCCNESALRKYIDENDLF